MAHNGQDPGAPVAEVMLPCYGEAGPVKDAVRSILAQDVTGWRLTVVDDGVPADLEGWLAGLSDPRIRYLRNEHTLGVSGNFNRCLALASRELVTVFGCDDVMLPNYVRTVSELAEAYPAATAFQPAARVIDQYGNPTNTLVDLAKQRLYAPRITGPTPLAGEPLARSLLRGNWMYFPAVCWRREALHHGRFRDDLRTVQDLAFLLELVERGATVVFTDRVCVSYRRHTGSESSVGAADGSRFREERDFFLEAAAHTAGLGWHGASRAARWHLSSRLHALSKVPGALRRRDERVARAFLRHALGRA